MEAKGINVRQELWLARNSLPPDTRPKRDPQHWRSAERTILGLLVVVMFNSHTDTFTLVKTKRAPKFLLLM